MAERASTVAPHRRMSRWQRLGRHSYVAPASPTHPLPRLPAGRSAPPRPPRLLAPSSEGCSVRIVWDVIDFIISITLIAKCIYALIHVLCNASTVPSTPPRPVPPAPSLGRPSARRIARPAAAALSLHPVNGRTTVRRPTDPPTNPPLTELPTDQKIDRLNYRPTDRPTDLSTEQPTDRSTHSTLIEIPTDRPID